MSSFTGCFTLFPAGEAPDLEFLKRAVAKYPNAFGLSILGKKGFFIVNRGTEYTADRLHATLTKTQAVDRMLYLGSHPKDSKAEDIPPWVVLGKMEEPTAVAFLEGDFQEYNPKDSGHSHAFMAMNQHVRPRIASLAGLGHVKHDIPALIKHVRESEPALEREMTNMNTSAGTAFIAFNNGDYFHFSKGDVIHALGTGWTTDLCTDMSKAETKTDDDENLDLGGDDDPLAGADGGGSAPITNPKPPTPAATKLQEVQDKAAKPKTYQPPFTLGPKGEQINPKTGKTWTKNEIIEDYMEHAGYKPDMYRSLPEVEINEELVTSYAEAKRRKAEEDAAALRKAEERKAAEQAKKDARKQTVGKSMADTAKAVVQKPQPGPGHNQPPADDDDPLAGADGSPTAKPVISTPVPLNKKIDQTVLGDTVAILPVLSAADLEINKNFFMHVDIVRALAGHIPDPDEIKKTESKFPSFVELTPGLDDLAQLYNLPFEALRNMVDECTNNSIALCIMNMSAEIIRYRALQAAVDKARKGAATKDEPESLAV